MVLAGWFSDNSGGRTRAVGELRANPFGLFDVHGNVWEWVQDDWDWAFYRQFEEDAAIDPSLAAFANSQRVVRGGDRSRNPSQCRSSNRTANHPVRTSSEVGFRVVLPVDAVKESVSAEPPVVNDTASRNGEVEGPDELATPPVTPGRPQQ